jgi:hypothetical protein
VSFTSSWKAGDEFILVVFGDHIPEKLAVTK